MNNCTEKSRKFDFSFSLFTKKPSVHWYGPYLRAYFWYDFCRISKRELENLLFSWSKTLCCSLQCPAIVQSLRWAESRKKSWHNQLASRMGALGRRQDGAALRRCSAWAAVWIVGKAPAILVPTPLIHSCGPGPIGPVSGALPGAVSQNWDLEMGSVEQPGD